MAGYVAGVCSGFMTDVDSIVNEELPVLFTHHLTLLEAGVMNLRDYQPAISGSPHTQGAGLRVAWMT